MLQGQVREAVCCMTDSASWKEILDPSSEIDMNGKTVLEALREKFPDPAYTEERSFLLCDGKLPPLVYVNVTAAHVERVARQIHGGPAPSGFPAQQWQDFLLKYGAHSERLRDAMAKLVRLMANSVVEWDDIHALLPY